MPLRAGAFAFVVLGSFAGGLAGAVADVPSPAPSPLARAAPVLLERVSIHAQFTDTQQYHGTFPATYSGPQSMTAHPDTAKTVDATLFMGLRLSKHTEFYINPEIDQGFGLGNPPAAPGLPYNGTFGAAGFVSAEAYKVGRDESYGRVQRVFVRQTFDLGGGETQVVDAAINQLRGTQTPDNLIVTAGKFGVVDVFDTNPYAHDPKNDFLNWAIVDLGAFDYPADAWGYTYGVSAELSRGRATYRAGLFQLSATPNEIAIEHQPLRQYGSIIEYERRTNLFGGHPGSFKGLIYQDTGYMGSYAEAVARGAASDALPFTGNVRTAKHAKVGGGINLAQEIAPDIGVFVRASAMNGTWEAYDFADIDRSVSAGLSIDGTLYHRPADTFGLGAGVNDVSGPARAYFAAGGLGVLVGDGALSYGGEHILESYYKFGISKIFGLTFDYQRVTDPAYNTARGPISVYGLRYHAQF